MECEFEKIMASKINEAKECMTYDKLKKCEVAVNTAKSVININGFRSEQEINSIPISATQIKMVLTLGKIFKQEVTEDIAKERIIMSVDDLKKENLSEETISTEWLNSAETMTGVTAWICWKIAIEFAQLYREESAQYSGEESLSTVFFKALMGEDK